MTSFSVLHSRLWRTRLKEEKGTIKNDWQTAIGSGAADDSANCASKQTSEARKRSRQKGEGERKGFSNKGDPVLALSKAPENHLIFSHVVTGEWKGGEVMDKTPFFQRGFVLIA